MLNGLGADRFEQYLLRYVSPSEAHPLVGLTLDSGTVTGFNTVVSIATQGFCEYCKKDDQWAAMAIIG